MLAVSILARKMTPKDILRKLTPPIVWSLAAKIKSGADETTQLFEGPFPSWDIAKSRADGWDAQVITDKTATSARRVRDGLAAVEQDGVESAQIPYSSTVLAFLSLLIARHREIDLIDFGGGLGANYFQNRKIVKATGLPLRWNVIERPALVDIGTREFQNHELRFFKKPADVVPQCDSVIFTGSFQYLEQPEATLDEVAAEAKILAFDRLVVSPGRDDGIYVQHPDPHIYYRATYPTWCFSKSTFVHRLATRGFRLVENFPLYPLARFELCGFLFVRQ
jgi:putative methyltransferase (TIGR04325 family)